MPGFDLYLRQNALDEPSLYEPVLQTARYVERMEQLKRPVPDELAMFLTLEVYFGRSRNAGHRAFFHENYHFPAFSDFSAQAARAMKAHEYADIIDEFGALMVSDRVKKAGPAALDVTQQGALDLKSTLADLDTRSYGVRIGRADMEARLAYCSDKTRAWVLERYKDEQDEAYYALASAWLMTAGTVKIVSSEAWRDLLDMTPRTPKPAPPSALTAPLAWLRKVLRR